MTQPDTTTTPAPFAATIPDHWQRMARAKGYRITRRGADRYRIVLLCECCGLGHTSKRNVLMDHTPVCPHCVRARWQEDATAAGLEWLGRDPHDPKRGRYRAPCGHEVSRQFELIKRIVAGACALRCETCQRTKEEAEATAAGWTLLGPAHERGVNYRRYRHDCGHEQEIARVNMRTERVSCAGCGVCWSASPSFIYCMRFKLPGLRPLVKLGFSRNPESRMNWQLLRTPDLFEQAQPSGQILRSIQIRTGHLALCQEKKMHAALRRSHPGSVVPAEHYGPWLNVKSEIYAGDLEPVILDMLDRLDPGAPAPD
ncbi:GIY-YIG nuclease family protein [Roseicyclus sp. F158]|uniref:GIY-YIG nuclease family protein n=1 Tax=Tropicimonas omnivorans TaxID=3075590 RepID=A0ABU3DLE4_9RHOB|nr:GIY-YIG nuclease family protein [Roseicyclus sp. F158]MDT0684513.1 GIY-YIG nuclease family protein [Roseicyclus sp. F158]